MRQNRAEKREGHEENLSEAIAKHENLAKEAAKSGDATAANRNTLMAAIYRAMLDHL